MERSFLLLVCLCVARAEFPTTEFVEQLRPYVEKCEEKTGVDKVLVEQFSKGEDMADDTNLKLNTESGVFRYEKMLNLLPEEMKAVAFDMGHACVHFKGEEGSDLCQVSYDLHKCWQKRDPKHYFLF